MKRTSLFKAIVFRTLWLFMAMLIMGGAIFALAWRHHTRNAESCVASGSNVHDPVSCTSDLWLFVASWQQISTALLALSGFCIVVALAWSLTMRKTD